jgi:signal transduction histidine kinase
VNPSRPAPSIRRQLTLQILAGALLMLLVAGLAFFAAIHHRVVGDFDRMLEAEAEMLARNAERKGRSIVWDVPDTYSPGSQQTKDPAYCQLFLEDGTVVGLSQTLGAENLPRLEGRTQVVHNRTLLDGRRGRIFQKTFRPRADDTHTQIRAEDPLEQIFTLPVGMKVADLQLVLVVARSRESLDRLLGSLGLAGGGVALALACGVALLVRRAITRGLRPIDEMNAQIATIAPQALATRLHVSRPPVELAAIETAVNRLLDRVESAFEKERRFSSDLAHELRTPIAELRTACEVGARWPDDIEATRQFFLDTGVIALQLEKIVATMLALSRCDSATANGPLRLICLETIVRECWHHSAPSAEANGLRFHQNLTTGLAVECDEDKLAIVIRNLVENAVAHSPPDTVVECSTGWIPEGTELRLVNTTADLERADLDRIFDRFWRKDASRSDRDHIGLGLSIARAMCDSLGLRLSVDLHEGQLFEARIIFPMPSSAKGSPAAFRKS